MEKQNITLSIPKELLYQTKIIAVQRRTSVSKLMTEALEELVHREQSYEIARKRQLAWLREGFDLGSQGESQWSREALHER